MTVNIRAALETHLAAMAQSLPTAWENRAFTPPVDGGPYQEAFVMLGAHASVGLKQRTTLIKGIFQITLCYPADQGAGGAEARARMVQAHFNPETLVLDAGDGVRIRFKGKPAVGSPVPGRPGRFVVPVSVRFEFVN